MDANNTLKVSDFGLSCDIYEKNYFRQDKEDDIKLPIKWMAIESITDGIFSTKTDVVSPISYICIASNIFAVVIWCNLLGDIQWRKNAIWWY